MDEKTVPDLIDDMAERVREIAQTRVELLEEREQAKMAGNQLQMLRNRCSDFNMDDLVLFVKTRTTDIQNFLADLEEELESIESDFEELVEKFKREQEGSKDDFDESSHDFVREIQNTKSVKK